jgi:phosphoribosylpyrophosphate synthetase
MKIISGNANPLLAQEIADHCFATLVPAKVATFADGESSVEFRKYPRRRCFYYSKYIYSGQR